VSEPGALPPVIRPTPPSLVSSAVRIFDLSLGQMLWSRRSVLMGVLLGGPVVLAAIIRIIVTLYTHGFRVNGAEAHGSEVFGLMMWMLYVAFNVPLLGIFFGTSLIADEVDDKTITYLFTRPIPRAAVLLGKYLAYVVCTILLVLPSVILVFFLVVPMGGSTIAEGFPFLLNDLAVVVLGLIAYGAVFALVGTRLKRPLIVGLVFAFGWEPAVVLFPGYLNRLTVAYYLHGLVKHERPQDSLVGSVLRIFNQVPSVTTSLLGLAVIVAVSLWLAARTVENREYVLEQ
jgi:ABC-2 type transport system permease protein